MKRLIICSMLILSCSCTNQGPGIGPGTVASHPRLVMTPADIHKIRDRLGRVPLFDASLEAAKLEVDAEIAKGIDTPVPKDYSGGYTHSQHKKNYAVAQKAGALYLILGEEKYAQYVRDMLMQYAGIYKDLPLHPKPRSYARGKIFWQCLNDANWLVFMSQAYDSIHEYLSVEEQQTLEADLFRPFADHISKASPQFFNRIHNHSTWGTAAVGMIGLVMNDEELIRRALYGLELDNFSDARDNDGGFIRQKGQKAGFLANLDNAFSPDGYYTEGPYYQRYAMYPYLVFAQSLRNAGYREQAFERNDGVLLKAVDTLIQLSDGSGSFFPLNDAQKGMSLQANELVTAVDIAYQASQDQRLLDIVEDQQRVLLDGAGFAAAIGIANDKTQPFNKTSIKLTDGRAGNEGGLTVLRSSDEQLELLFKYTAQGLSHGHYDKLSFSIYDQGQEVLQDYGMARFVNIGQKGGGNYLPENNSWAKQSIAHNTLIVNETSHFQGKYELGNKHHSTLDFFDASSATVKVVSAVESNAYPGSTMRRTMALLQLPNLESPVALDILAVQSNTNNQYDLPFHFHGQVIDTNINFTAQTSISALGTDHGYQHLNLEANGQAGQGNTKFSWLNNGRFYTLTSSTEPTDEVLLLRIGAKDPNFNLRRDPALMIRRNNTKDSLFVSILEPHGNYNPITEQASNASSSIAELKVLSASTEYTTISITTTAGDQSLFLLANSNDPAQTHELQWENQPISWVGPYHFIDVTHP